MNADNPPVNGKHHLQIIVYDIDHPIDDKSMMTLEIIVDSDNPREHDYAQYQQHNEMRSRNVPQHSIHKRVSKPCKTY